MQRRFVRREAIRAVQRQADHVVRPVRVDVDCALDVFHGAVQRDVNARTAADTSDNRRFAIDLVLYRAHEPPHK